MSKQIKLSRYEATIQNVINTALITDVENKILKHSSVIYVKLSEDLSVAKVYLDCYDRSCINKSVEAANKLKGLFRSKVAAALNTYKTPELIFLKDDSIDYANNIENILKEINKKTENQVEETQPIENEQVIEEPVVEESIIVEETIVEPELVEPQDEIQTETISETIPVVEQFVNTTNTVNKIENNVVEPQITVVQESTDIKNNLISPEAAAQTIIKKQKLLSKIEQRLLSTKKFHQSWWIILGITILYLLFTAGILAMQFYKYYPQSILSNMITYSSYGEGAKILVYVSYGVFVAPYLYFAGAWMAGVNNLSRSKSLHLALWIIYTILFVMVLIALILSIRSMLL